MSHLLLNRIDEIQKENSMLNGNNQISSPKKQKVKEDIVKYIEKFENDLDIDNELDYDLDIQYKYRDDNLQIEIPELSTPNNKNKSRNYSKPYSIQI